MDRYLPTKIAKNTITNIIGVLLLGVAFLHLLRVIKGWTAIVNGWVVPIWVSGVAFVLALYVAFAVFRMDK